MGGLKLYTDLYLLVEEKLKMKNGNLTLFCSGRKP